VQSASARWVGRIAPELIDGDTLLHTDVTPRNFLRTDSSVTVVDWSMPCRGAAWIDTALMVLRLVHAGHSPDHAEAWAERVPAWSAAHTHAVTAFATATAELMRERQRRSAATHLGSLADAAELWMRYRLQAR
jgi:thiamine kinase-like enzyme